MNQAISELIYGLAQARGNAPFLSAIDGRPSSTFADLQETVASTGRILRGRGVSESDRVVIVSPNGPEAAAAFLSVASHCACAPLNPGYSAEQFTFYIDDLQPSLIVMPAGFESPIRHVASELGLPIVNFELGIGAGLLNFPDDEAGEESESVVKQDPEAIALLLHTSGTTARPKLVPLRHRNLVASAAGIASRLGLTHDDRSLNVMPLFHIHGIVGVLLSSLVAGSEVVCSPGLDPSQFKGWLRESRPTWYSGVPTMHTAILSSIPEGDRPFRSDLRFIRSSSASLPETTMHDLEKAFNVPVVEAYGMTEAAHQMAANPLPPGIRKPGSVGLPAGPDVSIRSKDGTPADEAETGEVWVRGDTIIDTYVDGRSPESFVEGWFRTGDLGRLDSDGYLFLVGRIKEMVNRGGENVAPAAVESVLLAHPGVAEAAVFAVPHPTLGEDVAAAVVLAQDHGRPVTSGDIRAFALEKMSDAEVPGQIVIVRAIPKGPTGKVQRSKLYEQLHGAFEESDEPLEGRIEEMLARIWRESLGESTEIRAWSNFFALGGDSLSGTRVAARVGYVFQIEFDIRELFSDPTMRGMARRIEQRLLERLAQ